MSMNTHTFVVPDASCEHCVNTISNSLLGVTGVYTVDVDLDTKEVTVNHDVVVNTGAMRRAIQDAGYSISGENTTQPSNR